MVDYLFTGDLSYYTWSKARMDILVRMGKVVISINEEPFYNLFGHRLGNLQLKLGFGPSILLYNKLLLRSVKKNNPKILWVDKGCYVMPETLRWVKNNTNTIIVNFNTDYLGNLKHYWGPHFKGLKFYDFYFTSNKYDIKLLKSSGINCVEVFPLGYYSQLFINFSKLHQQSPSVLKIDVGFIGHWEPETERIICELYSKGVNIRVCGSSWKNAINKGIINKIAEFNFLSPYELIKRFRETRINLCINSHMNRNQTSGRSFEIVAAGGFLLAQRTEEHSNLYDEGTEAEFFSNTDELVEKINYYLVNERYRSQIAENGQKRCILNRVSFEDIMLKINDLIS